MIEIFLLAIVQGITEFLPISSSAHLILISKYFNFENNNLTIDMSLHVGSLLAVLFFFKNDFFSVTKNKNLFFKIVISSIPVMCMGYLLVKFEIIDYLRSYKIIGWMTIIFGVFLYFADKSLVKNNINKNFSIKFAIYIGLFQVLSLVPGVSRSGITISAARILNFDRENSTKIAFLLSVPTLVVLSLFNFYNLYQEDNLTFSLVNFLAIFLSFIFSYFTIRFFLDYVKKFSLNIFVIYRICLGFVILLFSYL